MMKATPAIPCARRPRCAVLPLAAALLAGGCTSGGAGPGGDGGPGAGDPVLVNPSRYNTVLGRPTDRSVAVSVLAAAGDAAWVEYGARLDPQRTELSGPQRTAAVASAAGEPIVIELDGLERDTRYYYRVHFQPGGQGDVPDNLHSFLTQRAPGRTFHFGVQGDTHPERYNDKMFHPELYTLTMEQVRARQPDLYFLLGDDFSIEKIIQDFKNDNYGMGHPFQRSVEGMVPYEQYGALPRPFQRPMIVDGRSAPAGYAAYRELRERYLGLMANATSLFLVNGNHEQAASANLGGIFNNASIWAADGRLKYYPLPAPGGVYSGDRQRLAPVNGYPTIQSADGLLRDYYAFTWGDALFVTIDPYWHSDLMPETSLYNGDANKDVWNATMGDEQYAWLKETLESSRARWKFVFAHHINGTGRGAAGVVGAGEWGGATRDFKSRRPGWSKPVHQLLADTGVTIFFQGHDHLFSREKVDGVVYQEVPNPGDNSYFAYNCDAYAPAAITWQGPPGYGAYDAAYGVRLPNSGYLDVTVSADLVRIDYIRTYREIDLRTNPNRAFTGNEVNGEVAFSYSIPPQPGDRQPRDVPFTCLGAAPPAGWVYNR